jgi:sugar fermentation stimulation protein A
MTLSIRKRAHSRAGWTALRSAPPLVAAGRQPVIGRFLARPHRFAAVVELDGGQIVYAHLPNPGRLTGVLSPGCEVAIDGPFPPPRVLTHTLVTARVGSLWVGTVTTYANQVFPALLRAGLLPELGSVLSPRGVRRREHSSAVVGGRPPVTRPSHPGSELAGLWTTKAEVTHGRSRFDFQVGDQLVEVKSVTSAEGSAGRFPDAVTARGARHCVELAALARHGRPTAVVFVAQRGDLRSVTPDDDVDPEFGKALRRAARAGVAVLACALDLTPVGASRARRIDVLL